MRKDEVRKIIGKFLHEIEEEDVGISLFSSFYQNDDELDFFKEEDRKRVLKILGKLSEDSRRHKHILKEVIEVLEQNCHEK